MSHNKYPKFGSPTQWIGPCVARAVSPKNSTTAMTNFIMLYHFTASVLIDAFNMRSNPVLDSRLLHFSCSVILLNNFQHSSPTAQTSSDVRADFELDMSLL